jgi:hypothetical protein
MAQKWRASDAQHVHLSEERGRGGSSVCLGISHGRLARQTADCSIYDDEISYFVYVKINSFKKASV